MGSMMASYAEGGAPVQGHGTRAPLPGRKLPFQPSPLIRQRALLTPPPGLAAAAAGLSLAKECGLKQSDLIEVVKLGAIAAPMFALKVRSWGRLGGQPARLLAPPNQCDQHSSRCPHIRLRPG